MATILATQTVCVALLTHTHYLSEFPGGLRWAMVARGNDHMQAGCLQKLILFRGISAWPQAQFPCPQPQGSPSLNLSLPLSPTPHWREYLLSWDETSFVHRILTCSTMAPIIFEHSKAKNFLFLILISAESLPFECGKLRMPCWLGGGKNPGGKEK